MVTDLSIDVSANSQSTPSVLPDTEVQPVEESAEAAWQLPTERGKCPFDPPAEYTRLRDEEPTRRFPLPGGDSGWLISRYADVRSLLADPTISVKFHPGEGLARELPPEALELLKIPPGQFIAMDAPEHTRYRRLLTGQFTVRRMNALIPRIEQIVADHLDAMAGMTRPVDLVENFALPVPSLVICELLGVPYADRAQFQLRSRLFLSIT